MVWFLAAFGLGLLWLGLHPFTTYPLSLWLIRTLRKPPPAPAAARHESFALCCCAYNEERVIGAKLDNCLALRAGRPDLQILFYVDAATDRTAALLQGHDVVVDVAPQRAGKTHGMNRLTAHADASVLVFTDANVILDPDVLANLERAFADPAVGCVCGHLRYVNAASGATAALGAAYWRFEEWVKQLETDTGSAMGADGSLFAIRGVLARPVPEDLIDDMFVSLSILCDGWRVVRAADVRAYELATTAPHEEFRRKVRIACQAFNVHRRLWPRLRRLDALNVYKYVSHKLLRWISGVSLAAAGLCFELALALAGFAWLALAALLLFAGLAVLGWRRRGALPSRFWDVLAALAGTALGIVYSLRGAEFRVWTSPQSVRERAGGT
ncbi:MAG TPA: glycosyltransferase [Stellaceae bacterium]|nr:glycosyltransferase [Stellaceae bacterium]